MNLDDESLLTAYLDGELSPRELVRVEEALRSDPSLGKRLSELARVRELVAGLPRPAAPFDLSQAIVHQLGASPVPPRRRFWRHATYVDVALFAAAVLLTAGFVGYLAALRSLHAPRQAGQPIAVVATPAPSAPLAPVHIGRPRAVPEAQAVAAHKPDAATRPADDPLSADERAQFQAMIDSPNLKRVFFVVDAVGGRADERVGELVESIPRADSMYACMTIVPNMAVDPKHPGPAKVYAVALTDPELEQVRDRLLSTFPGAVEESAPEASVVTQLADIGQVSVFAGSAVPELERPAEAEARITALKGGGEPNGGSDATADAGPTGPTPEQLHSAPAIYVDRTQPAPGEAPAVGARRTDSRPRVPATRESALAAVERLRRNKPNIVLIWVASR